MREKDIFAKKMNMEKSLHQRSTPQLSQTHYFLSSTTKDDLAAARPFHNSYVAERQI